MYSPDDRGGNLSPDSGNPSVSRSILDLQEGESRSMGTESEILAITVYNALYPITVPVILKVCDGIADVLRVKVCGDRGRSSVVALVEFRSVFDACKVRDSIHGADIYDNCCTLEVAFSGGRSPLFVERNDEHNWDYRLHSRSARSGSSPDPAKRRTLLNLPRELSPTAAEVPFRSRKREASPDYNCNDRYGRPLKTKRCGEEQPYPRRDPRKAKGDFDDKAAPKPRPHFCPTDHPMNRPPRMRGNVLMLYDLDSRLDPNKIFNLLCLYGDVGKIKFLMTKEGCAMVEMADGFGVGRVLDNLNGCPVFGKKITIKHSWQESIFGETDPNVTLPNGSPAFQDFRKSRNLRFNNPVVARKNRIVAPCKVLHFFNVPSSVINSKEKMSDHLASYGIAKPVAVSFFPGSLEKVINSGLIEFATLSESVDALVLCNNSNVQPSGNVKHFSIKFCFSKISKVLPESPPRPTATKQEQM